MNLIEYDICGERESRQIEGTVRLGGNGWYIDVSPTRDGLGLTIRSGGSGAHSDDLAIDPICRNTIEVSVRAVDKERQRLEREHLKEVAKANKEFWKGKKG